MSSPVNLRGENVLDKMSSPFDCFLHDGLNRCKYCQHVLYIIDDYRSVCLNCGSYFESSKLKPTSLFDACSASTHGKDSHEL